MNELLKILLSLSASGSLLILFLFLCKPLFAGKINKQWQYYIWLIVIARLLLPFAPETNLVGSVLRKLDSGLVQSETATPPRADSPYRYSAQGEAPTYYPDATGDIEQSKTAAPSVASVIAMATENLWLVWLVVAVALLIRKLTAYQSFVKYSKAGRTEVTDLEAWEQVGALVEQAGIKRTVSLYTNSLISSPLLIGFIRPCIMLPTIELSNSDLEYTILHELTHCKRQDMLYKWLVQLVICIHWFNPLVYLMGREISRACELSCDEVVIQRLDKQGQRAYGDTLLNAVGVGGIYKDAAASVTLYESQELLKERLDAIMKYRRGTKLTMGLSVTLALTLCLGATTAGAYAIPTGQPSPALAEATVDNNSKSYVYTQSSYYQAPYIFEIGYNINETGERTYPDKANLTLPDKTTITVSFSEECKEYATDKQVLNALTPLLVDLAEEHAGSTLPLESPLIVSVHYVGNSDLNTLASEYYSDDAMTRFAAIFPELDTSAQKMYYDRMFADGKIAFFSSTLDVMDADTTSYYAKKAYDEKNIAFFSTIIPYLTDEAKEAWTVKSSQDGRSSFLSVLNRHNTKTQDDDNTFVPPVKPNINIMDFDTSQSSVASGSIQLPDNTKELDISFDIDNGGVEILHTDSDKISSSYDGEYYDVDVTDSNGKWNVTISGKVSMMGKTDWVKLYIPNVKYTMEVDVSSGNFSYALPQNCQDVISITAKNAGIDFTSINKYENSNISLTAVNKDFIKYQPPVYPDYFTQTNSGFEYSNGTKANQIDIKLTGYTSVDFTDASTINRSFKPDSKGTIAIPVDISTLGSGSEICLGAIPDTRNAKSIRYDVHGESGGSLFVGISPEKGSGTKNFWVGSVENATRNIVWDSGNSACYSEQHTGDYYVYIRSKYGDCSNITGSIVIEYNT